MAFGFADDPHSQDGQPCPRNFFGITIYDDLKTHETRLVQMRSTELIAKGSFGKFDSGHLRKIHWYLFQDVFPWAGEFRVVGLSKVGGAPFASPHWIVPSLLSLFAELQSESYLQGLSREDFADRAGYYWGELNSVHPFREGNGRAQREFLRQLGVYCGHKVSWARLEAADNRAASIVAHAKKEYSWLSRLMLEAMKENRKP